MFPQSVQQDIGVLSSPPSSASTTSGQLVPLGTRMYLATDQGRKGYRYIQFPVSTALTSGILLTAIAAPANSTGLALPTTNTTAMFSAGSQTLFVTNGATAVTVNEFQDGMLEVLGTNGIGQSYRIRGNTLAAGSGQITVYLAEPLRNTTALANSTNTVNLRYNIGYTPASSAAQGKSVGVTIMPVASSASAQYGWVQIFGEAYVNATNSGTLGYPATQDLSTAGNVANIGSGAAETSEVIGVFVRSAASSLASVMLNIA